jgi:hypothetical protein
MQGHELLLLAGQRIVNNEFIFHILTYFIIGAKLINKSAYHATFKQKNRRTTKKGHPPGTPFLTFSWKISGEIIQQRLTIQHLP